MKNILKILVFNLLFFSCDKKTDIGIVKKDDQNCIEEIEKAKKDFRNGKKTYFILAGLSFDFNQFERTKQNLKNLGINAEISPVSCLVFKNLRANCYELEMNYLYEKEFGAEKLKNLIYKGELDYLYSIENKIFDSENEKVIGSLNQKINLKYPPHYNFSNDNSNISYYKTHISVEGGKINLEPEFLYKFNSKDFKDNMAFDYYLRSQIIDFLNQEIPKTGLKDGYYYTITILK